MKNKTILKVNGMDTIPLWLSARHYHFVGVDHGKGPDETVFACPCGSCGAWLRVIGGVIEKCNYCGDDGTPVK